MLEQIPDHPAFIAVITFILGIISTVIAIRIGSRTNKKDRKAEQQNVVTADLAALKNEVWRNTVKIRKSLSNNCFNFTGELTNKHYLVSRGKLEVPEFSARDQRIFQKFESYSTLEHGLVNMIREFYEKIHSYQNSGAENGKTVDYASGKWWVFELTDGVKLGNELYYQIDWVIKSHEDPEYIDEQIRRGVQRFDGDYEGTWAVPWLKNAFSQDDSFGRLFQAYDKARKNTNDTGIYI